MPTLAPNYSDLQSLLTNSHANDAVKLASLRDQRKGELEDALRAQATQPTQMTGFGGQGGDPKNATGGAMTTPNPNLAETGNYAQLLGTLKDDISEDPYTGSAVKAAVAQGFNNPAEAATYGREVAAREAAAKQNVEGAQAELARSQATNNPLAVAQFNARAQEDRLRKEGAFGAPTPSVNAPVSTPPPSGKRYFNLGAKNESIPIQPPTRPTPPAASHLNLSDPNQFRTHVDAKGNMAWTQINSPAQLALRQETANNAIGQIDRLEHLGQSLHDAGYLNPMTSALYSAGGYVGKGPTAASLSFSHPLGNDAAAANLAAFYQGLDMLGPNIGAAISGARGGAQKSMQELVNHATLVGKTDINGLKGTLEEMRTWMRGFARGNAPGEDLPDTNTGSFIPASDQE